MKQFYSINDVMEILQVTTHLEKLQKEVEDVDNELFASKLP